jgi:hemoglobin/transferrin/lactoferrin receptor protein
MKYSVNMRVVLFILVCLCLKGISAQEIHILDIDTGEAVINAAVYNQDKSRTMISGVDGSCDLSQFEPNERIYFKHLGYQTLHTTKAQVLSRNRRVLMRQKSEQLNEVVMSATRWEQRKKDVPQKIVSINAPSIAFTSPQTSADLLQHSGQVFVQKSQLGGGSPMIRGFSTNRLLLSVDGVRMNNAIFRGGNLQNIISIDPFSVQKTEVIFGPGTVLYGSDAIGGVMNFYTREAKFADGDSLELSGSASYRHSTANREHTVHADISAGMQKWGFLSSLSFNDFGDLKMGHYGPESYLRNSYVRRVGGKDSLLSNAHPSKQLPSGYSQWNVLQKVRFRPDKFWDLQMGLYYSATSDFSRYDRLIRPDSSGEGLRSAEWYYGPQRWFMSALQLLRKGRGHFFDGLKLTLAYQHFDESRNDRDFNSPLRFHTSEDVDALSANIDIENRKIGPLQLYYGAEFLFNAVGSAGNTYNLDTGETENAASRYPDGAKWQSMAGYLNAEYKPRPNLSILGGMRYSHVWIAANFDNTFYPFPFETASLSNGALTGSLGLSWFPQADLQITLNTATGFRSPNIDDVGKVFDSEPGSVVVPNPGLEPEYAYSAEIGIVKGFREHLELRGAAFYTYLADALVRRDFLFNGQEQIMYNGELSDVQAIQNAARAYVYGFEIGINANITERLALRSNLTVNRGYEEDDSGEESPARHAPPVFGDIHLVWRNSRLKTDLFLNFSGEVSYDDLALSERGKTYIYDTNASGNPYSPAWHTLNFRSSYHIGHGLQATLNLENITNRRYRPYSSGIAYAGTSLILGLTYTF